MVALVAAACAEEDDDSAAIAAVGAAADAAAAAQGDAGAALGEAQTARAEAAAADAEAAAATAAADAAAAEAAAAAALAQEAIAAADVAKATAEGNQADVAAAEAALDAAREAAESAQADAAAAQAEAAAAQAEATAAQSEAAAAQAEAEEARSAAEAAAEEAAAAEAAAAADAATGPDGLPLFGTPERCEANRAAGPLVFMTGFDLAAAAGIIEVVVAEDKGYFDDMCLDVTIQPGFAPGNSAALAAGTVQLGVTATFGELVTTNIRGDADLMGFAQLGHTAISQLLIDPASGVTDLTDLEGMTMGIKGDIPIAIQAMIAKAGLQRGTFEELLLDGFNPVEHFALGIEALPVYRSNEPRWLDLAGIDYITFDPLDYEVPASFAIYMTTRSFYEQHPTVVEDFVRAGLRGYYAAAENPQEAIDLAFERIEAAGNVMYLAKEHELYRWTTDQKIIEDVTPDGLVIGQMNVARLGQEIENLVDLGVYETKPDWLAMLDASVVPKLYDGDELIWASMN